MVYLNGVEGLRWGPGVWCVRVLIHGRWSGGEDRNLKAVKKGFRELLGGKKGEPVFVMAYLCGLWLNWDSAGLW